MDLTSLTKLSRDQLDAYARRAGIAEPHQRSAAWLIATLVGTSLAERMRDADRILQQAPRTGATRVAQELLSVIAGSRALQRFARPTAAAEPVPPAAPPARAHVTQPEPTVPTADAAVATVVATLPATVTPDERIATRRFVEEPIRTRSMARLLLAQGHRNRAIAILESIALANPHDVAARDDLERLRTDVPLDPELARLPEPHALPTLPDTGDGIELRALPGRELHISWTTTDAGQSRANAVLGVTGELALRVVAIAPDPTRVVRSEITERAPVERSDAWTAPAVLAGSRCFAAIGMRAGGRFVAIAHAPARTID